MLMIMLVLVQGAHEDLESNNQPEETDKEKDLSEVVELSAPPTKKS